jgi:quercetin 2,3-dioxygenase
VQRITAGRGIWHGGTLETAPAEALQLWINLARAQKGLPPSYQTVAAAAIPEHQVGDATVRVLVGAGSPLQLHTPARYYDVALPPHGQTALAVPAGFQGFVYVLQGVVALGSTLAAAHATQIAVMGEGSAEEGALRAQAGPEGARFVLAAGQPHREPVRFNGNFVD